MKCLFLALVVLFLTATGCTASHQGRVLPEADLELLAGGTYDLQQTGQPRALNLWATWCAPCRAELPAFDDVANRVDGVDIVGINVGDTGPDATELVEELGLSFAQALDPNAIVQQSLQIIGMPSTIFVDADGEVVQIHTGELEADELEMLLRDLFDATFSN